MSGRAARGQSSASEGISFVSRTLFLPRMSINAGKENWDICSADFNKDGFLDIAVVSKNDNTIQVLFNNGAAAFEDIFVIETITQPRALCVIDANADGFDDLAVVSLFGEVALLLNNGAGTFRPGFSVETDMAGVDICAADVNGDKNTDLALALVNGNVVWVMAGNGAGGFTLLNPVEAGNKPRVVRLADFNGDAFPDMITGCDDGYIHLHYNDGLGGFHLPQSIRASADTWGLAIGDLNADGLPDIVTSSYAEAEICVILNKGQGKFALPQRLVAGEHNFGIELADFDKDNDMDIIACSMNDKQIYYYGNTGKGEFETARMFLSGYWNSALVAADFDSDGDPDVITVSINDSKVNIHRNIVSEKEPPKGLTLIRGVLYNFSTKMPATLTPITVCNSTGDVMATTLTNDKGEYVVGLSEDGIYTLLARSGTLPVYCAAIQVHGEKEIVHDLSLSRPDIVTLQGKVVSARDGSGVTRAQIQLFNHDGRVIGQAQTTQNGLFRLTAELGEFVRITVSHRWYKPYEASFVIDHHPEAQESLKVTIEDKRDLAALEGVMADATSGMPLSGVSVGIFDLESHPIAQVKTDFEGRFVYHLPEGRYKLIASARDYYFFTDTIDVRPVNIGQTIDVAGKLTPLDNGNTVVLDGLIFPPGDARVDLCSADALRNILNVLEENPELIVEISGHTDSDGADAVNLRLSQARAQSVVTYLTQSGISAQRLMAKGYGETKPIAPNDTPDNKRKNRRIELMVVGSLQIVGDRQ